MNPRKRSQSPRPRSATYCRPDSLPDAQTSLTSCKYGKYMQFYHNSCRQITLDGTGTLSSRCQSFVTWVSFSRLSRQCTSTSHVYHRYPSSTCTVSDQSVVSWIQKKSLRDEYTLHNDKIFLTVQSSVVILMVSPWKLRVTGRSSQSLRTEVNIHGG